MSAKTWKGWLLGGLLLGSVSLELYQQRCLLTESRAQTVLLRSVSIMELRQQTEATRSTLLQHLITEAVQLLGKLVQQGRPGVPPEKDPQT